MSDIFDFSQYSVEAVYAHLGLKDGQPEAREAVAFIYNHFMRGEYKGGTPEHNLAETLAFLKPRLDMITRHEKEFFPHGNHKRGALMIAALCDYKLHDANNFCMEDNEDAPDNVVPDFSCYNTLLEAERILDEVRNLTSRGMYPDEVVPLEAVFTAHLYARLDFLNNLQDVADYSEDELSDTLDAIRHARTFLRHETGMGQELLDLMQDVSQAVKQRLTLPCVSISFNGQSHYVSFDDYSADNEVVHHLMEYMPAASPAAQRAMKIFWQVIVDEYDGDEDREAAQDMAERLVAERMSLFTRYTYDIGLSAQEHEAAVCSWLLANIADLKDKSHTRLMNDQTISILTLASRRDMMMPTLSQASGTKASFAYLALRAYDIISETVATYEYGTRAKNASTEEIRVDADYADSLLREESPFPCELADDVKEKAAQLISLTRPLIARRQICSVTNNRLAPPTLHV